ncbi:hypothetical protein BDK51DRAFT_32704 [Blyttiomyces helicus]|uniref:DDE Tnp4 domain-containing protein n=1 Tax=Blyttiomyces helicus TaxID=388810 RepID=A0A4P9WIC6_9FUNG|nr:hypothetical protein BDK51DRAFT_32704 [Blyttiomyces helicus]|eukprot:RKO92524.1 hypothetical protein BDK51DRAFT_32704 [Blyttiomyces helicus]
MPYINHWHWRRLKRMNPEAQYAKVVTCAATMLQLSIILFQTSLRDRHYLTTSCLVDPLHSFWHSLYAHGTYSNLISVVGIDRATFEDFSLAFSRFYIVKSAPGKRAQASVRDVQRPPRHSVLANAEVALQSALKVLPDAHICWRSFQQQRNWARLTHANEPLLEGRWGFIDAKNYRVRAATNAEKQNAMYNGENPRGRGEVGDKKAEDRQWCPSLYRLSLGLQAGSIRFSSLVPYATGLMGRSSGARTMAWLVEQWRNKSDPSKTLDGYGVVADSAFPVSKGIFSRIFTLLKDGDLTRASPVYRPALVARSNVITSLHQAAEWGMGSAALVFRRLDQKLPYHPHVRGRRLANIYRLYNLRVCRVGITQIGTVFGREEDLI